MRQPHCLSGLPNSLVLCMWLGEVSVGYVARLQHKLQLVFFFFPETLTVLCCVPFSFPHQLVSAKHENYRLFGAKFGATAVIEQPAKRAEIDGAGGIGAMVCLLYAAFC